MKIRKVKRKYCKAKGCPVTSKTHPGEALHAFPRDDKRRFLEWCKVAECESDVGQGYFHLCHRHFRRLDYIDDLRQRIQGGSLPVYPTGPLNAVTGDYCPTNSGSYSPGNNEQLLSLGQCRSLVSVEMVVSNCSSIASPTSVSVTLPNDNPPRIDQLLSHELSSDRLEVSVPSSPDPIHGTLADLAVSPGSTNSLEAPLVAGINVHIFEKLKQRIDASKDERFAYCALQWGKMSLKQYVDYCLSEDITYGFEDLGNGRHSTKLAEHALVFSLVGLFYKWKQPIAFYFTTGRLGSSTLTEIIKSVLLQCSLAGVMVKVTICDGESVNRQAYHTLGSEVDKPFFVCNGVKVYTMFDPPHLLKNIRNMLINHPLRFNTDWTINGQSLVGIAEWKFVVRAVAEDKKSVFRLMKQITPDHIQPTGPAKMRVKLAAQVLSYTVASTIDTYVRYNVPGIDARALPTAEICSFFDELFDSFNGYSQTMDGGGGLRTRLTRTNQYLFFDFWNGAIEKLSSMAFLQLPKTDGSSSSSIAPRYVRTPTLSGWMQTIIAVKMLWIDLTEDLPGISYLATRNLNKDPTEHLFDSIRSKCGENMNPSALQFVSALNDILNSDINGNCEGEHVGQ